jgi:hypothetical protein
MQIYYSFDVKSTHVASVLTFFVCVSAVDSSPLPLRIPSWAEERGRKLVGSMAHQFCSVRQHRSGKCNCALWLARSQSIKISFGTCGSRGRASKTSLSTSTRLKEQNKALLATYSPLLGYQRRLQ